MCITHKKKAVNNYKLNNLFIKRQKIKFSKKKTNFINGGVYLVRNKILKYKK